MRSTESVDDIPYPEFRTRALSKRRDALAGANPDGISVVSSDIHGVASSVPGGMDMISLYRFWSHFLARHFDLEMFEEFRACAVADATGETASKVGLENLIAYYETILEGNDNHQRPLADMESLYNEAKKLAAGAMV